MGIVLQGFTQGASGGKVLFSNIPGAVTTIGGSYAGPLAISIWIAVAFAVVLFYVLEQTPLGRSCRRSSTVSSNASTTRPHNQTVDRITRISGTTAASTARSGRKPPVEKEATYYRQTRSLETAGSR